jgi:hypothetical protein
MDGNVSIVSQREPRRCYVWRTSPNCGPTRPARSTCMVLRSLKVMRLPSESTSFMHGNNKWQSATKLEMDQIQEYDTFHDKGIRTTPGEEYDTFHDEGIRTTHGEEFKKIQIHILYLCKHRILFCSVRWGVTIFPYVDKWTRAHVIG